MRRETLQTILGLCIIVIIVTATFLYGNAQRQSQLKRDQNLTSQQSASPKASSVVGSSSNASSGPNSAPVNSPSPNAIQGSQVTASVGPNASPKAGAPASTAIPDTGSGTMGLIGLSALALAVLVWMRSRRAVLAAARSRN